MFARKDAQSWTIAVTLVALFVSGTVGAASFYGWTHLADSRVTILVLGSDEAIMYTAKELSALVPFAERIDTTSLDVLASIVRSSSGTIVIVGHGTATGISTAGDPISWGSVGSILRQGPSHAVLIAACYSQTAHGAFPEKRFFGFPGIVDVDEAAHLVAASIHALRGRIAMAASVLEDLVTIMTDKADGTSGRPLLTLDHAGYHTKSIRGIWHVRYNPYYTYRVLYTHPDTYVHYRDVGIESSATLGSLATNLIAGHVPKSQLDSVGDSFSLALILSSPFATVAVRLLTASWLGALITAALAFLGWYFHELVEAIRDESGSGWAWIQNRWQDWWGEGMEIKVGSIMWFRMTVMFGQILVPYPIWYGGNYLGIDGW